jgi:hypothetical protein
MSMPIWWCSVGPRGTATGGMRPMDGAPSITAKRACHDGRTLSERSRPEQVDSETSTSQRSRARYTLLLRTTPFDWTPASPSQPNLTKLQASKQHETS